MDKSYIIKIILSFAGIAVILVIFCFYSMFRDAKKSVKAILGIDKTLIKSSKSKSFYQKEDKIYFKSKKIIPLGIVPFPITIYSELKGLDFRTFEIISTTYSRDISQIFHGSTKVINYKSEDKIKLLKKDYLKVGSVTLYNWTIISEEEGFDVVGDGFTRENEKLFVKNEIVADINISDKLRVITSNLIFDNNRYYFIGKEDDMGNGKYKAYPFNEGTEIKPVVIAASKNYSKFFYADKDSLYYRNFKLDVDIEGLKLINERSFYTPKNVYTLIKEKISVSEKLNEGFDLILVEKARRDNRYFLVSPDFKEIKNVSLVNNQSSFNRFFLVQDESGVFFLNALGTFKGRALKQKISNEDGDFNNFKLNDTILEILGKKYYFNKNANELVQFDGEVSINEKYIVDNSNVYIKSYEINLISALDSSSVVFYKTYAFDRNNLFNHGFFVSELYDGDYKIIKESPKKVEEFEVYKKRDTVLIDKIEYRIDIFDSKEKLEGSDYSIGQLAISNLGKEEVSFSKEMLQSFTLRSDDGLRTPFFLKANSYPLIISPGSNVLINVVGTFKIDEGHKREFGIRMYDFISKDKLRSLNVNNQSLSSDKGIFEGL